MPTICICILNERALSEEGREWMCVYVPCVRVCACVSEWVGGWMSACLLAARPLFAHAVAPRVCTSVLFIFKVSILYT